MRERVFCFLIWQPFSWGSRRSAREGMSAADGDSSILSKTVFSACGDRRHIKVKDSEEGFCGPAEPRGFLSLHKRFVSGCKARVELWTHYRASTVTCSRHRSTSASLVRPTLFKFLNKSSENRAEEQQRSQTLTALARNKSESVWSLKHARLSVKVCQRHEQTFAQMSANTHGRNDTQGTKRQCHIYQTNTEEDRKHKPLNRARQ